MELYHFLFSSTFVYFFSFKILFITMFCGLMCNHLHKKYIINYEIKGQYKMLTKTCNYPVNIYNKLTSYNYNNTLCLIISRFKNSSRLLSDILCSIGA